LLRIGQLFVSGGQRCTTRAGSQQAQSEYEPGCLDQLRRPSEQVDRLRVRERRQRHESRRDVGRQQSRE
jgi:hypothetical protein